MVDHFARGAEKTRRAWAGFVAGCVKDGECLRVEPSRYRDKDGYCTFGKDAKRAHRVAWEKFQGRSIPAGKQINHTCNVRDCINPEHLYVGTQADNMRDAMVAGTHVAASGALLGRPGLRGEANGNHRFTDADIDRMVEMRKAGQSFVKIGRAFDAHRGVARGAVRQRGGYDG